MSVSNGLSDCPPSYEVAIRQSSGPPPSYEALSRFVPIANFIIQGDWHASHRNLSRYLAQKGCNKQFTWDQVHSSLDRCLREAAVPEPIHSNPRDIATWKRTYRCALNYFQTIRVKPDDRRFLSGRESRPGGREDFGDRDHETHSGLILVSRSDSDGCAIQ